MKLPSRRRNRPVVGPGRHPDPTVQVVYDAIAFATAAIVADVARVRSVTADAMATDEHGFIDALATTVAVIAEEARDHGADVHLALQEVALGIHLAAIDESFQPVDRSDPARRPDPAQRPDHDHPEG